MDEHKFTEGPWQAMQPADGGHFAIMKTDTINGSCSITYHIANAFNEDSAHLIACAPELYLLAKQAQEAVLKMARKYGAIPVYLDNLPFDEVLAKARGEQ